MQMAEALWLPWLLNWLVLILGTLLSLLVLIQRGKGGGLAGMLGGSGGASAFGSRAGDLFTRITLVLALVWLLFIALQVRLVQQTKDPTGADDLIGKIDAG